MAEIKKYLDNVGLGALVDQIKAEDAKVLDAAKKYTDEAPFDAAGSAATAKSEAIAAAEEKVQALANGQVKLNKEAIEKLNGDATTEGSVAKAVKDAQDTLQTNIDGVDDKADANAEAIAAINNAETGILKQAKDYTDTEVGKVQDAVDALDEKVGALPEGADATSVVDYIDKKTANIASDETVGALADRVTQAETDIDNIEKDYLKAADKEELAGNIQEVATAVQTEKERAEGVEGGFETRIKAIEDDYLKAADKKELQDQITENANAITLLTDGVDAEKVDGVKDLINYVEEHGTEVTGMKEDIADNASAIEGVAGRMTTAEGKITAVEGAVATKAEAQALTDAVSALEEADAGQVERIAALEAKFGEGEGNVEDMIATAKQEAIDTAAGDATTKANTAESNAKKHADDLNTAMNTRVEALEAIDHTHANQAELDKVAEGDVEKWNTAAGKAHEHANAAELAKVVDGDVAKWNAAEQNAKDYAKGLDDATNLKVDGVDGRVKTLEETIVDKVEQDDFDAAVARIAANETAIAANTSAINSFVPMTSEEVLAYFA